MSGLLKKLAQIQKQGK